MRIYKQEGGSPTFVQLFGERNSGTTYFRKLIQDGMRDPSRFLGALESDETPMGHRTFGYKHWFADPKKLDDPKSQETLFVVIYRNPYTWIRAMMAQPYSLSDAIDGKSLGDLETLELVGRRKNKDTTDEVDPNTGDRLTLFGLRQRKIENFEGIKKKVLNVAYLQLEDLLKDPARAFAHLAQNFPTVFDEGESEVRAPYKQLLDELEQPNLFDADDERVIDEALDWRWERQAGYSRGDYSIGFADRSEVTVLHGGSGAGKTSLMHGLAEASNGLMTLEMDACKYWEDTTPELTLDGLQVLLPTAKERDLKSVKKLLRSRSIKMSRCVNYLMSRLKELGLEGQPEGKEKIRIVATCGALPGPASVQEDSLYTWLEERLPVVFRHVLIDVPEHRHKKQIEKRGRGHLSAEIGAIHSRMVANRHLYDAAVSDLSGLSAFVGHQPLIKKSALPLTEPAPSPGFVRIFLPRLTHIQIYGERGSGTKYLTSLVSEVMIEPENVLGSYATKTNPENKAKMIGYKHYYPNTKKISKHGRGTLFLVVHKNPYTWIRSMLKKPYHFKADLEGKTILDLPGLRLAGLDVHGRQIPDVHPETGELLTIFELRRQKILAWEKLTALAENVAFLNYESLLQHPTENTQAIVDAYPSLFSVKTVPLRKPDPRYLEKYMSPQPFTEAEMDVMDSHIDWEAEAIVGYQKGNLFI